MLNALLRPTDSILSITHTDHEIKDKMYALIHRHILAPDQSSNNDQQKPMAQRAIADIFQHFVFANPLC